MDETLVETKGTIGFLGPGEMEWTADTGGLRAKSFGTRLNDHSSVLKNWHQGRRFPNHPDARLFIAQMHMY